MVEEVVLVAIYGAIISTIALSWNIYKYFTDKPKLKVKIVPGFITQGGRTFGPEVLFSVVNVGKRPVNLSGAGLDIEDDQQIIFMQDLGLPKKLIEGDSHEFNQSLEQFKRSIRGHTPKYFWFSDKADRKYRTSLSSMRRILKD